MNVYKIEVEHFSPKDSARATVEYLLADNDDEVYEHLKTSECNRWNDSESDGNMFELYDDEYNVVGTETFREKIMRLKGDMNEEDIDLTDAYYGVSVYGWELVKEDIEWDTCELIECGILTECEVI